MKLLFFTQLYQNGFIAIQPPLYTNKTHEAIYESSIGVGDMGTPTTSLR